MNNGNNSVKYIIIECFYYKGVTVINKLLENLNIKQYVPSTLDIDTNENKPQFLFNKLKNIMRACFIFNFTYSVLNIFFFIAFGFSKIGIIESIIIILLNVAIILFSLLSFNKSILASCSAIIISLTSDLVLFIIFMTETSHNIQWFILVTAILGTIEVFSSSLLAISAYSIKKSERNIKSSFLNKNMNETQKLSKFTKTNDVYNETVPIAVNLPSLKDYIEEPEYSEIEIMTNELKNAFKSAGLK